MSSKLYAPCFLCINIAKWIPVLFITATVMWSYYAYVVEFNLYTLELIFKKVVYLFLYHIFLVLFLWTYWQTIFTESGKVPRQFRLPASELELYLNAETEELRRETLETFCQRQLLPVTNRTLTGDVRYCDKCHHIKPDRCHHCSVCGACILKMDHHCPWVNNCVSYSNYKFFVLFLGYAFLYCLFVAATTLEYFIRFWSRDIDSGNNKFQVLLLFFVSMMFGICLVSLLGYHIFLVTKNRSTIESFRGPIFWVNRTWIHDKEGFSLGSYNNFLEVFGDDKKLWFLPIFTSAGDGTSFPLRNKPPPLDNYCSSPSSQFSNCSLPPVVSPSYGSTNTSLGDGISYPQRCVSEDSDGLLRSHHGGGCGVDRWSEDEEPGHYYNNNQHLTEVMVQPAQSFNV